MNEQEPVSPVVELVKLPPVAEDVVQFLQFIDFNVVQPGMPMVAVYITHPKYHGPAVRARFTRN